MLFLIRYYFTNKLKECESSATPSVRLQTASMHSSYPLDELGISAAIAKTDRAEIIVYILRMLLL
jgi:hypothetical protein